MNAASSRAACRRWDRRKTGMHLGYGRPINRSTDSRSSRSSPAVASSAAVVALTGSSMRFAYPISPSAALTDCVGHAGVPFCDLDSVGPAANAGVSGVGVRLPSDDAVQSVFGQRVRPRAAEGCARTRQPGAVRAGGRPPRRTQRGAACFLPDSDLPRTLLLQPLSLWASTDNPVYVSGSASVAPVETDVKTRRPRR